MRVIFMGTPDFSVPTLNALVDAGHDVIAVVAQPDRPSGRGKKMQSPATIVRARELGIETKQPRAVRSGPFVEWMTAVDADVAVVVAYGRILIPALLQAPRLGCVNVHASLLPKYRGAAPINWAVVNGEKESGVCTMQMAEGLDTGDVLLESRIPIGENETAGELHDRLAPLGASLAVETLRMFEQISPRPQNHGAHTVAPLISRDDACIEWTDSAQAIHNRVRGFNPWPTTWTTLDGERLKIHRTRVVEGRGLPGTVIEAGNRLVVATGDDALVLEEVQLPGKRAQVGKDLVNGGRVSEGMTLGQEK
ncbi:MAG: methionyl-tRNA formyltransferase [Deltaproteobacteria bacterium]|nr:methionyl-tRNA formyltransferase [Deltaproteobacteria bacterium]